MLLEVKGLSKQYQRGERAFTAVDNVDLSVCRGDFVSIIGRSGSGKSTFLNMLAGLLTPTSGSIQLNGTDIRTLKESAFRNSRLGYIPQGAGALSNLNVFDNVRLPYYFSKRHGDAAGRASFLLEEVGQELFYKLRIDSSGITKRSRTKWRNYLLLWKNT